MVLYSQYGGLMKNTGKRLRKYTALALAMAIVSPVAAFASEQEKADIILTETKLETNPYQKSITMSLLEDGTKISYDIDINKDQAKGNLSAYIYQLGQSNIENLSIEGQSQSIDTDLGKAIKVDLKDQSKLRLTADIKEGQTDNLSFDLILVDDSDYTDHTHIDAKLVKNADKLEVEEAKTEAKNLGLSGVFTDSDTIAWTDSLVNNTNEPIKTDYILNVSSNQSVENQKLRLDFYHLTSESYKLGESSSYDLGSIKDLEIAPFSLVKLSFTTKVMPSNEAYQINDAIVTNNKTTSPEELSEVDKTKENQAKELTENLKDTSKEIQTTLVENEKNQDAVTNKTDEKLEDKLHEVKTVTVDDNKAKTKEIQAQELTQKINSISGQISQILQENEAQLPDTIMNGAVSEENTASSKELTAIELTNKLERITGEIEETLKTVVTADQYNKFTTNSSKEDQAQELIKTLNNQTSQILEVLRQVELGQEANYLNDHPEELAKIDKLLEDVEKFDENTKQTIKENQEKNKDYVSPHFVIVKEDFSKEVYKKLENVVTVTLDPLERKQTTMTKEEIKKEYPSIAHYLENLELRSDLLNSLK